MALTFTYDMPKAERISRNLGLITGTITFDNAYPYGGESIGTVLTNAPADKFSNLLNMSFDGVGGCVFDAANDKVKVFGNAPAIVFEEKHTASSNSVTLNYPAAWIINVTKAGQNQALTARADTLGTDECKLTAAFADGVRTGITTKGATDVIFVTYVTQAWVDLYALLVDEESLALATGGNDLVNKMAAFGYCYASTGGLLLPVDTVDTADAGEVEIKFDSATNQISINSNENGETGTVTYLKVPPAGSWLLSRWVYDEDAANAGADPFTNAFNFPLLMWGITGALTVNAGVTQKIIESGVLAAAGEINLHNWTPGGFDLLVTVGSAAVAGHVWGAKSNVTVTAGNYIKGHPWEIPNLVQLEVNDGTDLSHLTVRFTAIGAL